MTIEQYTKISFNDISKSSNHAKEWEEGLHVI
jgi:hypothetical protein